jgi:hypothetical protein
MKEFIILAVALVIAPILLGCSGTEVIESPKTGYVPETREVKTPQIIWTSRTLGQSFEYLGFVQSNSWTYDGALDRLVEGARELRADAIIDVHFERVGFLSSMQAFAIKYTN